MLRSPAPGGADVFEFRSLPKAAGESTGQRSRSRTSDSGGSRLRCGRFRDSTAPRPSTSRSAQAVPLDPSEAHLISARAKSCFTSPGAPSRSTGWGSQSRTTRSTARSQGPDRLQVIAPARNNLDELGPDRLQSIAPAWNEPIEPYSVELTTPYVTPGVYAGRTSTSSSRP